MKLVRRKTDASSEKKAQQHTAADNSAYGSASYDMGSAVWKILIADDEPDVHAITKLSLKNFRFADRKAEFLNAMSGKEAEKILRENPDIAVAMIDVVMETEDAGLRLVKFIRQELKNTGIRLIIRTGQPGTAPERYVIDHFDIDDYKEKTELVADKLYTTLRAAVKAYRDIGIIQRTRTGLEKILKSAPELYRIQPMKEFFEGVLTQIAGFCHIGNNNLISTVNGFIATAEGEKVRIQIGTGKYAENILQEDIDRITAAVFSPEAKLPENALLIPLKTNDTVRGFIYMENAKLADADRELVHIMANQCSAALENIRLYNELEHSNRLNENKNRFLGMAAHDLRNPLGCIKMSADLLRGTLSDRISDSETEMLDIIKTYTDHSMNLVSDLLDIAMIESGKLELELFLSDLPCVIESSIRAMRFISEAKQIQIVYNPAELPRFLFDQKRMHQVFVNLLSNAVKYSYKHTVVTVSATVSDKEVTVAIKDQGQGIPEKDREKLFQPFVKTSVKSTGGEESTGLGLVICKKIIEAHSGRIWVESRVDMGSTFYVSLPVTNDEKGMKHVCS